MKTMGVKPTRRAKVLSILEGAFRLNFKRNKRCALKRMLYVMGRHAKEMKMVRRLIRVEEKLDSKGVNGSFHFDKWKKISARKYLNNSDKLDLASM